MKRYKRRFFVLYAVVIILLIIGFTYALITDSLSFNTTTAMIGIDEAVYGSTTFDSSELDFKPILDSTVGTSSSENNVIQIDFNVRGASTNNASDDIIYDIALNDLNVNCTLLSPYIKWKLIKNETEETWTGSLDYKFDTIENGRLVLTSIQQDLPTSSEDYDQYTFYMWFSDSCQSSDLATCKSNNQLADQSALLAQNLAGKIEVELYTKSKKAIERNPSTTLDTSTCLSGYVVTFDLAGGTIADGSTSMVAVNNQVYGDDLQSPTKETSVITFDTQGGTLASEASSPMTINWTFGGWYKEPSFINEVTSTTVVTDAKNHTLYAKWDSSSTVTLPSATKIGYVFTGWYTAVSGGNKIGDAGSVYNGSGGAVTLYAHWEAGTYMVSFDYDGGTGDVTSKKVTMNQTYAGLPSASKNTIITYDVQGGALASDASSTAHIGWTFEGWYKESSFINQVTSSTKVETPSDHTLYAKWSFDDTATVTLPSVTRTGYTFSGWYTAASGGTKVGGAGDTYTNSSNITLYAQWIAKTYTVSYNSNLFVVPNKTVNGLTMSYDSSASYLTLNGTPTKGSTNFTILSDQTFTEGDQYKITLTYVSGSYTKETDTEHYLVTEVKQNVGYNHVLASNQLSTRNVLDLEFPTSGTTTGTLTISTLGASDGTALQFWHYASPASDVTFTDYIVKVNISKVVSTKTVTYDSTYGTLMTPDALPGYVFDGWYTEETGGTKITSTSTVSIDENHTLYARWTEDTVSSIEYYSGPLESLYYSDEALNTTALMIKVNYANSSSRIINADSYVSSYTTNTTNSSATRYVLTITYGGKTTTATTYKDGWYSTYYYQNGAAVTGDPISLPTTNGGSTTKSFYMQPAMYTGWRGSGTSWRYYIKGFGNSYGYVSTSNGTTLKNSGYVVGAMVTSSWAQIYDSGGTAYWYYLASNGYMKTGWYQDTDSKWYYLRTSSNQCSTGPVGSMVASVTCTIGSSSFTFNASGACTSGSGC